MDDSAKKLENTPGTPPATELSGAPKDSAPAPESGGPKKPPAWRRLLKFADRYFLIFTILILGAGIATFVTLNKAISNNPKTASTNSLTSQQISQLKGSTTIVGDSQQTLDVQSNSVFEGSVLMRNNLDVAGTIKVGGALSLSSVTVGGAASFGQAQVNGSFAATGNTTLQGLVSIQKNLTVAGSGSFGSLSASQLNVSSLQLTGDLSVAHHIVATGGAPGRSNGSALGSGGTASVSGGDSGGTVAINTGSGASVGCFVTINFSQRYGATPHVVISPSNSSAGSLSYYTNRSASGFSICTANAPSGGTTYLFDYIVFG